VRCHSGAQPKGDLDLSGTMTALFSVSYENLVPERRGGNGRKRFDLLGPTLGENHPKTGNVCYLPPQSLGSHASVLGAMLCPDKVTLHDPDLAAAAARLAVSHKDLRLPQEDRVRLTTWIDANAQYYDSYFGRRNLKYRDLPDFRPVPTFASASGAGPAAAAVGANSRG